MGRIKKAPEKTNTLHQPITENFGTIPGASGERAVGPSRTTGRIGWKAMFS